MKLRFFLILYSLIFFVYFPIAKADFEVNTDINKWPSHIPQDYQEQIKLEQEQLEKRTPFNPAPKPKKLFVPPLDDTYLNYIKFNFSFGNMKANNIKNLSHGVFDTTLAKNNFKDNIFGLEIGYGYGFEHLRFDLSYLINNKVNFDSTPLFIDINRNEVITSKIRTNAVLINAYYDIIKSYFLKPYLGLIIGASYMQVKTIMSNGIGNGVLRNKETLGLTYGINNGVRINVMNKFMLNLGHRYLKIGKTVWQDSLKNLNLKTKPIINEFLIGLVYLL